MNDGITVLVCGGRDFGCIVLNGTPERNAQASAERRCLYSMLDALHRQRRIARLVAGGASGADTFAEKWATLHHISRSIHMADWDRNGRGAGPIRNQQMLDREKPDLVMAFPGGSGTADMVRRAKRAGVEVIEVACPIHAPAEDAEKGKP